MRRQYPQIKGYHTLFIKAFNNGEISIDNIAKAIATFERTLVSGNAPFDRYQAGDATALTQEQIDGFHIFRKASCATCHFGPSFTNGSFTNIGIGMDKPNPDLGRYEITHDKKDWGAFKVPTLREVTLTYPYMHDGSLKTLEEVVEHYDKGGIPNPNLHPLIRPLHLTEYEKKALVSFMHSLNGEGWHHFIEPVNFPE